jgi:hypothetical protein
VKLRGGGLSQVAENKNILFAATIFLFSHSRGKSSKYYAFNA